MSSGGLVQDFAVSALVFAVAAFAWFGWGQENPPRRWRAVMVTGSALSSVMIVVAALLTWRLWGSESVFDDQTARLAFGVVCGIEFGLSLFGAAVLGIAKRGRCIATRVLLVVGLHFIPLAAILHDAGLNVLAVLTVAAAVASWVLYRREKVTPSAVTGIAGGGAMLIFAVRAAALAVI